MKIKNKTIVITSLILIIVLCIFSFLFLSIIFGNGVVKGREIDKERQRNYLKSIYMEGHVYDVTENSIIIHLDSISSFSIIFPREYIPPYQIIKNDSILLLVLDKKRTKAYEVLKGQFIKKELDKEYLIINDKKYILYD